MGKIEKNLNFKLSPSEYKNIGMVRKLIILIRSYYLPFYKVSHFSHSYLGSYCRFYIKSGKSHLHVRIVISTFWIIIFKKIYEIYPNVTNWSKNKNHTQNNPGGTFFKVFPKLIQTTRFFGISLKKFHRDLFGYGFYF